jgi:ribosomal protein S18 acetylase RimI-like enzyme
MERDLQWSVQTIRPASRDEVGKAVAVWHAANAGREAPGHAEHLEAWAAQEGAVLLVAIRDRELAGMVLCLPGRAADGAGAPIPGLLHLTGLAVLPEHQRQGLGSALLEAALDEARRRRCTRVTLWARASNVGALHTFESHGFRRSGRTAEDAAGSEMLHFEWRRALISWLTAVVHVPEQSVDRERAFWAAVSGFTPSPADGEDDVSILVPGDGDAYLRLHAAPGAGGGCQLEIYTEDPETLTESIALDGGAVEEATGPAILARSPGGFRFSVVASEGGLRRPTPRLWPGGQRSLVDQVCIDIPSQLFDVECEFWGELTGWALCDGGTGFRFLSRPASIPLRLLLQELGEQTGPVRSHLDLACSCVPVERLRHETLGATVAYEGEVWTTMSDPSGIAYCVTQRDPDTGTL